MHTVLVLGGYGFFGGRIAAALAKEGGTRLLIAGRSESRARRAAEKRGLRASQALALDVTQPDLAQRLINARVNTLIHTAGPFQGQGYHVAKAAIDAGCHYIDLADGRDFVTGIVTLDAAAQTRGVSVISGASSVPSLSSAVVDRYAGEFSQLDAIRVGIGSGARSPGINTVRGVFSYCGKPIRRWENGRWVSTYGWLDLQTHRFPAPVGRRFMGSCEVPDLSLFPQRYPGVQTVTFHAGFASSAGHLVVTLLSALVRWRMLPSVLPFAEPLNVISRWIEPMVSDKGGMFVRLEGRDHQGHALKREWSLIAQRNHGPHIPCGAAIALARKLAGGLALPVGAMPCMGLISVEEYLAPLRDLDIYELPA